MLNYAIEEAACCKFISVADLHNKILVNVAVNIYVSTLGNALQNDYALKSCILNCRRKARSYCQMYRC